MPKKQAIEKLARALLRRFNLREVNIEVEFKDGESVEVRERDEKRERVEVVSEGIDMGEEVLKLVEKENLENELNMMRGKLFDREKKMVVLLKWKRKKEQVN